MIYFKRLSLAILLTFLSVWCFGQSNGNFQRITVRDSVWLNGKWVKSFSDDSTLAEGAGNILPTQRAVRGAILHNKAALIDSIIARTEGLVVPDALNGVNDTSGSIELGGALTKETTIDIGGESLKLKAGPVSGVTTSYTQTPSALNFYRKGLGDSISIEMSPSTLNSSVRILSGSWARHFMNGTNNDLVVSFDNGAFSRNSLISSECGYNSNIIELSIQSADFSIRKFELDSTSARFSDRVRIGGGTDNDTRMLQVNGKTEIVGETTMQQISLGINSTPITDIFYPITDGEPYTTYIIDNSSGGITVNLPLPAFCPGRIYMLKILSDANAVTVSGTAVDMAWAPSGKGPLCIVQSTGTNWIFLQGF